jgi:hypothetical protein
VITMMLSLNFSFMATLLYFSADNRGAPKWSYCPLLPYTIFHFPVFSITFFILSINSLALIGFVI